MRTLLATTMMLLMMTAALAGCAGSDVTQDDVDAAYDNGYAAGTADAASVSTLDTIIARGSMKCGVKDSQFGMGFLNEDGTYSGLDIEYCKALAAAIGVDSIEYILATGSNRFELLASEEIDVLIRTTTWTTSRDAGLNADFAGMNFYDGQGMLVNTGPDHFPGATSALDLDGANICVGIGTTTEGNLLDYYELNNMQMTTINTENAAAAQENFLDGSCGVWTGDMSAMVARMYGLRDEGMNLAIMPELLSKEPLGAATRDNDDDWNDVVAWVWYGMITAEEFGIDGSNYGDFVNSENPRINRLLNENLGLGTDANPLSDTWMQDVLGAVGNYYDAYDRSFCDGDGGMNNCLISRAGTLNALVSEGGIQYAPPMR